MALSQKLEFRQSQSLVMTPQLMQAIKLLQLSNLDLAAFVDEELERNPLLERANDDGDASESAQSDAGNDGADASFNDDGGSDGDRAGTDSFEPGQEEWMNNDLGSRAEIEQRLDTGLDNVFPEEPADAAARAAQDSAPAAFTEWGGGSSSDE